MALFIRRVETVVSLKQLAGEPAASACLSTDTDISLKPEAPVSGIAWSRLPKFTFACDAKPRMSRLNSATDFARVPDVDDGSDGSSSGMAPYNEATAAAAAAAAARGGGVTAAKAAAMALDSAGTGGLVLRDSSAAHDDDSASSCEGSVVDMGCVPVKSLLDSVLLAMWEECAEQGLFRYDVTACPTKVVPGMYGFVAQLNEGRYSKKRPTEFRVDQVVQAFDPTKFNFTKAFRREVLFAFEPATSGAASSFEESGRAGRSPSVVLINVSPIDYGHVLLCPRVLDCLPQNLDPSTTRLALHFALEVGNPYLRVGFNSLGAFATINHLHFQAYYLAAPLPCERAPTKPMQLKSTGGSAGAGGVSVAGGAEGGEDWHPVCVSLLSDYPVRGWVVEGPSLAGMAQVVGEASLAMQAANIPHNVLIADCGSRVFIWPQAYAERQARGLVPEHLLECGVNPAIWEISGHMVMKRAEDYEQFTEAKAWELLAAVSLSEDDMQRLSEQLFGAAGEPVGTGLSVGGWAQAQAQAQAQTHAAGSAVGRAAEEAVPAVAPAGPQPMAGVEQQQQPPQQQQAQRVMAMAACSS